MKRKSVVAIALSFLMMMTLAGCGEKTVADAASDEQIEEQEEAIEDDSEAEEEEAKAEEAEDSAVSESSDETAVESDALGKDNAGGIIERNDSKPKLEGRYICTNRKENGEDLILDFNPDGTVDTPKDGRGTYTLDYDGNFTVQISFLNGTGTYNMDGSIDFSFGYSTYHMERDESYDNSSVDKDVTFIEGKYYCPEYPTSGFDLYFHSDGTVETTEMGNGTYSIDSDGTFRITLPLMGGGGTYNADGSIDITVAYDRTYHYVPDDRH